ncbi:DUF805 domain-containing protein [Enterovibrio norvegicus]|uniref:Uncharacterized membrane protein YhaH, DUF805 family n=2 Tax=Enterovibrio norvegicus TaxID=188144 RepID=A0A1I5V349_9GAMM|nr:DUF805 domain-containing protein [Enterovibrio norvegicus]MCC4799997.1 DUF805 domain-containing protein [Enterovibrio norvegicus]OEE59782.1 hypothetical protein A1OS_20760 [Enterovibrio norvegicus]OEF53895.1 hypothetical protein A1OW_06655 [Enterovibrio norvegicus]PMH72028.1 hypothetical protein BCU62_23720 [Enterovibrio norvegicus]PMI36118.1 hypothetical protein BCU46_15700 [Enterovibrio norvegicus]
MNWYIDVLKKYAVFKGRARRKEYWIFIVFNMFFSLVLSQADQMLGYYDAKMGIGTLGMVYAAAVFLPTLAVTVRRLHDTDRSGWWALLGIVPFGVIALLILQAFEGTKGGNRFGPDPKGNDSANGNSNGSPKDDTFAG